MLSSSFLDIAIGIVFVFLMLSLIASAVNEIISSLLRMRSKGLLGGVQTLLNDTHLNKNGLVEKIYNDGQVFGLYVGEFNPKNARNLPAYIPVKNFVMALLDVVPVAAAEVVIPPPPEPPAVDPLASARATLQAADDAAKQSAALASKLATEASAATPGGAADILAAATQAASLAKLASWRSAALKLAHNEATKKLGVPLLSMIDASGADVEVLKAHIQDWYNSAMDRVSGRYKYRTQIILFAIGVVLAVGLNADTVKIVQQLSTSPALRESVVAAATETAKNTNTAANPPAGAAGSIGSEPVEGEIKKVAGQVSDLKGLGIPLGWPAPKPGPNNWFVRVWDQAEPEFERPGIYFGWLLTAIAVSLGAPFWFDMLNKIMIFRSTVKPGEKSQPAKDKEKK